MDSDGDIARVRHAKWITVIVIASTSNAFSSILRSTPQILFEPKHLCSNKRLHARLNIWFYQSTSQATVFDLTGLKTNVCRTAVDDILINGCKEWTSWQLNRNPSTAIDAYFLFAPSLKIYRQIRGVSEVFVIELVIQALYSPNLAGGISQTLITYFEPNIRTYGVAYCKQDRNRLVASIKT